MRSIQESKSICVGNDKEMGNRVTIIVGAGAVIGTKDAIEDRVRKQQGRYTGTSGNAPTNTYAYQGASYADNAGATGDLVLSMHRQRHTGIL